MNDKQNTPSSSDFQLTVDSTEGHVSKKALQPFLDYLKNKREERSLQKKFSDLGDYAELIVKRLKGKKWPNDKIPEWAYSRIKAELFVENLRAALLPKFHEMESTDDKRTFVRAFEFLISNFVRANNNYLSDPLADEEEIEVIKYNNALLRDLVEDLKNTANFMFEVRQEKTEHVAKHKKQPESRNTLTARHKGMSMKKLALIHFYRGIQINEYNCDDIASKYDYTSKTSGKKLKWEYNGITKKSERTGDRGTAAKNNKHLEDLKYVLEQLHEETHKGDLQSDIEQFKVNTTKNH